MPNVRKEMSTKRPTGSVRSVASNQTVEKPRRERPPLQDIADPDERARLTRWVRAPTTPQRVVRRSRIVLMALDLVPPDIINQQLGVSRPTIRLWTMRFAEGGADALLRDAPGRGRRPSIDLNAMIVRLQKAGLLGNDGRPVSFRKAAAALSVSASAVWRAFRVTNAGARRARVKLRMRSFQGKLPSPTRVAVTRT